MNEFPKFAHFLHQRMGSQELLPAKPFDAVGHDGHNSGVHYPLEYEYEPLAKAIDELGRINGEIVRAGAGATQEQYAKQRELTDRLKQLRHEFQDPAKRAVKRDAMSPPGDA